MHLFESTMGRPNAPWLVQLGRLAHDFLPEEAHDSFVVRVAEIQDPGVPLGKIPECLSGLRSKPLSISTPLRFQQGLAVHPEEREILVSIHQPIRDLDTPLVEIARIVNATSLGIQRSK